MVQSTGPRHSLGARVELARSGSTAARSARRTSPGSVLSRHSAIGSFGDLDTEVIHWEVVDIVGEQHRTVCSGRAGYQRVGSVDGPAIAREVGLVAAGTPCCLPVGYEEAESIEESGRSLSFLRPETSFDLGDVHARRRERVSLVEPASEVGRDGWRVPQVPDQHRRVEDVDGQDASSVRRWARTHSLIDAWSSNSG